MSPTGRHSSVASSGCCGSSASNGGADGTRRLHPRRHR
jgi:hypothetical protein